MQTHERPNPALQLTAFGARDRSYFEVIPCSAPWRQLNAKPFGRRTMLVLTKAA